MGRTKQKPLFDPNGKTYSASDFGQDEVEFMRRYQLRKNDARDHFLRYVKPRADLSHKLYTGYTGDRARELESWRSNMFIMYTHGTLETLLPRILDARPDFDVRGRNQDDQDKAEKVQDVLDYVWEISQMDDVSETLVRSSMEMGTSWLKTYWKKDVRRQKFLKPGQDPVSKKPTYVTKDVTFYDAPCAEAVDVYALWYDWRNIPHESKQFFFHRLVLNGEDIRRRYPGADPVRLDMAFRSSASDLSEYGHVRYDVKSFHSRAVRNGDRRAGLPGVGVTDFSYGGYYGGFSPSAAGSLGRYQSEVDPTLRFYEVFECFYPFEDEFFVTVGDVPILEDCSRPIPFDHKEAPFIDLAYFRYPFEYEGVGIPLLLEQAQLSLNTVKNQRMDNSLMALHKMFIINPLAGIKQEQLAVRPFGLVYSQDPNGVKPIEFSDIKSSAFQEEEGLKKDMRFASGVDDFSMGVGGDTSGGGATAVRHLRESTLERVRLFINRLGSCYSRLMRQELSMLSQFMSKQLVIRITGDDGNMEFPIISRDDLTGTFDFVATVIPSIAGQDEVQKKQNMDLFQLLAQIQPQSGVQVDMKKLLSKVLTPWKWTLASITSDQSQQQAGMPTGMPGAGGQQAPPIPDQSAAPAPGGQPPQGMPPQAAQGSSFDALMQGGQPQPTNPLSQEAMNNIMRLLNKGPQGAAAPSAYAEAARPITLSGTKEPPTVKGVPNSAGFNRGGKVNTTLPSSTGQGPRDIGSHMASEAHNVRGAAKKRK